VSPHYCAAFHSGFHWPFGVLEAFTSHPGGFLGGAFMAERVTSVPPAGAGKAHQPVGPGTSRNSSALSGNELASFACLLGIILSACSSCCSCRALLTTLAARSSLQFQVCAGLTCFGSSLPGSEPVPEVRRLRHFPQHHRLGPRAANCSTRESPLTRLMCVTDCAPIICNCVASCKVRLPFGQA